MRYATFVIPILTGCFSAGGGSSDGGCSSNSDQGPQPNFGPTVTQPTPPPAISGGTLAVLANGITAVVSDPDRDHIYIADLSSATKTADIALQPHDEPGRIIEDAAGRVHVVLRSGGALVTLDPASWTIATRRSVCPAPRGVAYEPATDLVHVACAGGELVSLPAAGGAATRTVHLDLDLRDVVVHGGHLVVSTFRTANLLTLDASGQVASRAVPPSFMATEGAHFEDSFEPDGAWRIAVTSDDTLYMLHQRALAGVVEASSQGGYGGSDPCGDPIVHAALTPFDGTTAATPVLMGAVVAVDFAFAHNDDRIAIVSTGNAKVLGTSTIVMSSKSEVHGGGGCVGDFGRPSSGGDEPVAVAFTPDDRLVVQSREPAALYLDNNQSIVLSTDSRADTGHAIFHANAGASIACASCHLEGSDDGRAWSFDNTIGARRTQSLRGGIIGTEPFHWDGDQTDFHALMTEVFGSRMAGPALTADQLAANQHWVDQIPLVPQASGDIMAVARGKLRDLPQRPEADEQPHRQRRHRGELPGRAAPRRLAARALPARRPRGDAGRSIRSVDRRRREARAHGTAIAGPAHGPAGVSRLAVTGDGVNYVNFDAPTT